MERTTTHRGDVNLDAEVRTLWAITGSSVTEDLDQSHYFEHTSRVLEGGQRRSMATVLNAWEWLPRGADDKPAGGENPWRHPEGWVNVYGPDWHDGHGQLRPGSWDFTILVVLGPSTGRWYVVKAEPVHLPARAYAARLRDIGIHRSIPRRMRRNPDGVKGSYELPWLWLEPLEVAAVSYFQDECDDGAADDALHDAKRWAAELRETWALEEEGFAGGREILVSPERMEAVSRAASNDDGTAALEAIEAIVDAAAEMERLAELA